MFDQLTHTTPSAESIFNPRIRLIIHRRGHNHTTLRTQNRPMLLIRHFQSKEQITPRFMMVKIAEHIVILTIFIHRVVSMTHNPVMWRIYYAWWWPAYVNRTSTKLYTSEQTNTNMKKGRKLPNKQKYGIISVVCLHMGCICAKFQNTKTNWSILSIMACKLAI